MMRITQPNSAVVRYEGPSRGSQYEAWREEICRGFAKADFDPGKGEQVEFEARLAAFSSLSSVSFRTGRSIVTRNVVLSECDDFILAMSACGLMNGVYAGRDVELAQNQMGLIDVNTPSTLHIADSGQMQGIRIPRAWLLDICPNAEDRLGRVLTGNAPLREMIARYTATAIEVAPGLDAVGQRLTAQHLVDLIGLLLGTDRYHKEMAQQRGYAAARLELMRSDIMNNLPRIDLSIGEIAGRYGLSARQAQRQFELSGQTFTEFVLENRLLLARKLLTDWREQHRKISDIAYAAGFADLSYFNRAFRKRFHATPSEIRRTRQPG